MKNLISTLFICLLSVLVNSQNVNLDWAAQMPNLSGNYVIRPNDIAKDAVGNIYMTGFYGGTFDFDPGPGVMSLSSMGIGDDMYVQN